MDLLCERLSLILDSNSNNSVKIANINKDKDNEEWVLYCTKKEQRHLRKN